MRQQDQLDSIIPSGWFEWWAATHDTRKYTLEAARFGKTIAAASNTTGNRDNIQIPESMYVFSVQSMAWVTGSPYKPTVPYRIGFRTQIADWFSGKWSAPLITGDVPHLNQFRPIYWAWPRELQRNDTVTIEIDNLDTANAITVDCILYGFCIRERVE